MAIRWYVIHAYSGFENQVADFIKEQAEKKGLTDKVQEVLVPTEKVMTVQNGAKRNQHVNFSQVMCLLKWK